MCIYPVKKFLTFYGTRNFITVFTGPCPKLLESKPPPVPYISSHLPTSPEVLKIKRHISDLQVRATYPTQVILLDLITLKYYMNNTTYEVFSFLPLLSCLKPDIPQQFVLP
jgi:hypothetical protein